MNMGIISRFFKGYGFMSDAQYERMLKRQEAHQREIEERREQDRLERLTDGTHYGGDMSYCSGCLRREECRKGQGPDCYMGDLAIYY